MTISFLTTIFQSLLLPLPYIACFSPIPTKYSINFYINCKFLLHSLENQVVFLYNKVIRIIVLTIKLEKGMSKAATY